MRIRFDAALDLRKYGIYLSVHNAGLATIRQRWYRHCLIKLMICIFVNNLNDIKKNIYIYIYIYIYCDNTVFKPVVSCLEPNVLTPTHERMWFNLDESYY